MTCDKNNKGKVYLVGAGPGDCSLLTIKAKELLENAEVVVYDRLVSDAILDVIPSASEKIDVGKTVSNHPVPQDKINEILLNKALENKRVIRLKGGDPFVFGRGGEELELLAKHQIPFEVVPGITSAIAAAAYAGIPVTHRDFCSSLHIITGHAKKDSSLNLDYESLVKLNGTLVFMMSVGTIGEIANGLISGGMSPLMPVAVVENGTTAVQRKFVGELKSIGEIIASNNVKSPATIIVGKVCSLSDHFDWFDKLPLKGCKVLVTRPQASSSRLVQQLRSLGATAVAYPCIKTEPIAFSISSKLLEQLDWIIFTSAVGVNCFFDKLMQSSMDSRTLFGKKIAVVGTQTASELTKYGIHADFVPTCFDGKHLAEELLQNNLLKECRNTGIFGAEVSSQDVSTILKAGGIQVLTVPVYRTSYVNNKLIDNKLIDIDNFDYISFTSASCVDGFVGSLGDIDYTKINAVCIGEQTAKQAEKVGMNVIVSDEATIDSMVATIKVHFQSNGGLL